MFRPRSKAFLPLLFAVIILLYIGSAATGGKLIFGSDTLGIFYFSRSFAYSSIRGGVLPLWNPYICSGMPFLAQPQSALFYPPNIVFLLLDTCRALNASILLHIYLAWLFMYLLALRMGMARVPAAASGAAFALSGFFLPRILGGHIPILNSAVWLPAVFLTFDGCLRDSRPRSWAVLTGTLLAFQVLAGHPQFVAYTLIILFLYLLYCLIRGTARPARIGPAIFCLILAAGLAAVQILPAAELLTHSIRSKPLTYREATLVSLPPENLVTLAVPDFFGGIDMIDTVPDLTGEHFERAVADQYWGRGIFWEMCPYIGIIPLMLAFIAVRRLWRTNRLVPFLFFLAVIALLMALGKYTPLYAALFYAIPGFKSLECPSRALIAFAFSASLLAGFGLGQVVDSARKPLRLRNLIIVAGIVLAAITLTTLLRAVWPAILRASLYGGDRLTYLPGPHDKLFQAITFEHARYGILLAAIWISLGTVLLSGAVPKKLRGLLVIVFIVADLMAFGWKYAFGVTAEDYLWTRDDVATLRDAAGGGRIIYSTDLASLNEGMLWRIPNICGHDPMILKRYNEFINLCRGTPVSRYTKILGLGGIREDRRRLIELLGVSAVVLPRTVSAEGMRAIAPLASGENIVYRTDKKLDGVLFPQEVLVAESGRRALAEASFPSFDPSKTLILEKPPLSPPIEQVINGAHDPVFSTTHVSANEIEIAVSTDRERFMVLSEIYYPGWKAAIDGRETVIYRGDYILRAIRVPRGDHRVKIWFDPPSLKKGFAISLITCLAVLLTTALVGRGKLTQ